MTPFTIRLKYDAGQETQEITLGIDVGSRHIGIAATSSKRELFASVCDVRDDVSENIYCRKLFRQFRRKRNCRYRERRYLNRRRTPKWLTPTINGKVEGHIRVINLIMKILPIKKIRLETAKFDVLRLQRIIEGYTKYPKGDSKTYSHICEYVKWRDGYKCSNCHGKTNDTRLEVHHRIRRRDGGTNIPNNLITLCHTCHKGFHEGVIKLVVRQKPVVRLRDVTAMNLIRQRIVQVCISLFGDKVVVEETSGVDTKEIRIKNGIPKSHGNDAFCIAGNILAKRLNYLYLQKCLRRHNRRLHKQTILSPKNYKGKRILTQKERKNGYRALYQTNYEVFGIRLNDRVKYKGRIGYITARKIRGYYRIRDIKGELIGESIKRSQINMLAHSNGIVTELQNQG